MVTTNNNQNQESITTNPIITAQDHCTMIIPALLAPPVLHHQIGRGVKSWNKQPPGHYYSMVN